MPQRTVQISDELAALDDLERELRRPPKRRMMIILPIAVTLIVSAGATAIAWYSYNTGVREGSEGAAPLLKPQGPAKVTPESPGGLAIPHQDKTVFQAIEGARTDTRVERLLPPPESPAPLPAPQPSVASKVRQAERLESRTETAQAPVETSPVPAETAPAAPGGPVRLTPGGGSAGSPMTPPSFTEKSPMPAPAAPASGDQTTTVTMPAPVKPVPPPPAAMPAPSPAAKAPSVARVAPKEKIGPAPQSGYGVQIASLSSGTNARDVWSAQQSKHKDLLGKLTLVVQTVTVKGKTYHRVQGGSLRSRKAAADLCSALKKRGVGCVVVSFGK